MDNQEQRLGHRRQPALGKAMPVTALLLNLNLSQSNQARSGSAHDQDNEYETPPRYFDIAEELQQPPSPIGNDSMELMGSAKTEVACLNCTCTAPVHLNISHLAVNEMCQRLCSEDCRHGLSLTGRLASQDGEQLRQDFLKQYEIAEALAKTSAMTSTTQMKQRLAARKLEMEIETPDWQLTTPRDEAVAAAAAVAAVAGAGAATAAAAAGDTLPPISDYETPMPLPRDLLLYLVR
ncbi:nocturnin-like [Drosophila grimshawi]|uniref:nocturnin-like n=1 Tax=Drosophila grimshawi TaxID=7222 RepID=UPI0013EF2287|nr:nocturnin-like [Drosophila grimshawi]